VLSAVSVGLTVYLSWKSLKMAEGERQTRGGVVHSGKNSATPLGAGTRTHAWC